MGLPVWVMSSYGLRSVALGCRVRFNGEEVFINFINSNNDNNRDMLWISLSDWLYFKNIWWNNYHPYYCLVFRFWEGKHGMAFKFKLSIQEWAELLLHNFGMKIRKWMKIIYFYVCLFDYREYNLDLQNQAMTVLVWLFGSNC